MNFRFSIKTILATVCMAVLLAGVPVQVMRSGDSPCPPRGGWYAGHHGQAGAAARPRRDDTRQLAFKVAVLTACAAGVGACCYFFGVPSIAYGVRIPINIAGIRFDLAFGAQHDPHARATWQRRQRR